MAEVQRLPTGFTLETEPEVKTDAAEKAGFEMLRMGLKALSQRALIAVSALFTLITVGSAFWLAMVISTNPTPYQLTVLGFYLAFVIGINLIVRRA